MTVKGMLKYGVYMVIKSTNRRISRTHVDLFDGERPEKAQVFAAGLSFYKLFLLFLIGSFLGDIIETVSCRINLGVWMNRSSVVWGRFSIVWGLAIVLATLLLYRCRHRPGILIFVAGTVLGGIYEFFSSVFHEIVFGKVFWDYSHFPFNLNGRVNLLFCLYWGIVAVIWIKKLYPLFSRLIEKIPPRPGVALTWILLAFMLINIAVSSMAMARYNSRSDGAIAENVVDEWLDFHFDNARMAATYPSAEER